MKKLILLAASVIVLIMALLLVWGGNRYGGLEGLVLRVRAEIAGLRPHDEYVPTPLPTSSAPSPASESVPDDTVSVSPTPSLTAISTPSPWPTTVPPSPTNSPMPQVSETAVSTSAPESTATHTPVPTATPLPTSTPTPSSSPTVAPTATPSPTLTPIHSAAASSIELTSFTHIWQTWNNCGPATLAMALSYYGVHLTQAEVGQVIRPNPEDRHAGADELVDYACSLDFEAVFRVNGNSEILKLLLSNGLPVIAPTWHINEKGEGLGHYRLLIGYSDSEQEWILYDSLEMRGISADKPYPGIRLPYDEFDRLWAVMNRKYVVVYLGEAAPVVVSILGNQLDDNIMWQRSLARAAEEAEQRADDTFAWFTLGSNLVAHRRWEEAAAAYDRARLIGLPFRMLWYQFEPFQAYYEVGRYDEVIALADATIRNTDEVEELHYWRGRGLQAVGDRDGARKAYQRALLKRPGYPEAATALAALGD